MGTLPVSALAQENAAGAPDRFAQELAKFPADYQDLLLALHEKYPNWLFVAEDTGLPFPEAVRNQVGSQSVLQTGSTNSVWLNKAPGYYLPERNRFLTMDAGGWAAANEAAVAYWMDPRNFLEEHLIFLFESLSFDPTYHTETGVEAILNGTFMGRTIVAYRNAAGETLQLDKTYAQVILDAAAATGVSPYYLAAKIRSEISHRDGSPSDSVTGQSPGQEGLYNFYNIGAYDGPSPIASGLSWAGEGNTYGRPWDSPDKSILGGAQWIGASYIQVGQDTNYLQRFNVAPDNAAALYTHQYMTNLNGAVSASLKSYDAYAEMGALGEGKLFIIPIYRDLPTRNVPVYLTESGQPGHVNLQGVNVRGGPGVSFGPLGVRLGRDAKVTVLSGERIRDPYGLDSIENLLAYPYWYRITFVSGGATQEGYIFSEYVDIADEMKVTAGSSVDLPWSMPGARGDEAPYFESSNHLVATVDAQGTVTAHRAGLAVIYAHSTGGMASVNVRVEGTYLEGYQAGYLAGYKAGMEAGALENSVQEDDGAALDQGTDGEPASTDAPPAENPGETQWVITPVGP